MAESKIIQAAPINHFPLRDSGLCHARGEEMLFKPLVMNNLYNQVRSYLRIDAEMKERKYGFKDACSRLVELDETIQLPSGYRLINGPRRIPCRERDSI